MTLTKVELAENLIEKFHLSKREAKVSLKKSELR